MFLNHFVAIDLVGYLDSWNLSRIPLTIEISHVRLHILEKRDSHILQKLLLIISFHSREMDNYIALTSSDFTIRNTFSSHVTYLSLSITKSVMLFSGVIYNDTSLIFRTLKSWFRLSNVSHLSTHLFNESS